jgi:hypothetical protein
MKKILFALSSLLLTVSAHGQWQTVTYKLKSGWNAIYLHGDASYVAPGSLFGSYPEVQEVWRWNTNPDQAGFTSTPLSPTSGTPEWSTWTRSGNTSSLSGMTGQTAYLVKCSAARDVAIVQRSLPPATTWVRNGANLLGFPTKLNGAYPTFARYFSTFTPAITGSSKIYKYVGGELGINNPAPLFSTNTETVDRNTAYWFSSEVVGNFYAPVQITLSLASGLDFGRSGSVITARVTNRTSTVMALTIAPVPSYSAPPGQEPITAPVPLTRRSFDSGTAAWSESLISGAYNESVPANSSVELSFGIDRTAMTGAVDAFYASLLRFTDGGNQFDILLPATARRDSLAGLWVGEARVTAVTSKAQEDAIKPTDPKTAFPLRYLVHVADDGTARVLSQVFLGTLEAGAHAYGICTKESGLQSTSKAKAMRLVATHLPLDRVLGGESGSGTFGLGATLNRNIVLAYDDPANPFVHQYHPDHDNLDANGTKLAAGVESYNVTRAVKFEFAPTSPGTPGWGSSVMGGTYSETITGLHKDALKVTGTFELQRLSELGTIAVTAN